MAASREATEPSLEALFAAAAASAKREHAALETNEAWELLTQEVLAPLAQAQELLLEPELRRCTEMQHRRKRPCAVRFSCYDLASLDHPSSQLLEVLLQLRAAQQRLLRMPSASARTEGVRALCAALRDQAQGPSDAATAPPATCAPSAASAPSAAMASAARFYAAGFDALLDHGVFLMSDRLGEELSSLSRFHLRCVFDLWGGLPRPIDIQASKWHELRFFQPREMAADAKRRRTTFSAAAIAAAEARNRPPLRVTLLNADGYAMPPHGAMPRLRLCGVANPPRRPDTFWYATTPPAAAPPDRVSPADTHLPADPPAAAAPADVALPPVPPTPAAPHAAPPPTADAPPSRMMTSAADGCDGAGARAGSGAGRAADASTGADAGSGGEGGAELFARLQAISPEVRREEYY